jgi:hypothetical protein
MANFVFNQTPAAQEPCQYGDPFVIKSVHDLLATYTPIPPFIFGLPGNLLIIIIASRKHNRDLSPSVYMTAMAVVDSILLLLSVVFLPLFFGTELIRNYRKEIYM